MALPVEEIFYRVLASAAGENVQYHAQVSTTGARYWNDIGEPTILEASAWTLCRQHARTHHMTQRALQIVRDHDSSPKTYATVLAEAEKIWGDDYD